LKVRKKVLGQDHHFTKHVVLELASCVVQE
jgi:hypothetical protein